MDQTGWKIPANFVKNGRIYSGYLCFYNDFFSFKADSVIGSIVFDKILYEEIITINNVNNFGLIPNGLLIVTSSGDDYRFTVINRYKVKQFLETKIANNKNDGGM